jgi:hypothetical protein
VYRYSEAALLAVAAQAAAVEAESSKPRVTASQHLLATYYQLAGRSPPPGVKLPDPSVAAPAGLDTTVYHMILQSKHY